MGRASKGSPSASMTARPRRASTAAIVVFPAPDTPLICTAFIGVYRRPALKADANGVHVRGSWCPRPQRRRRWRWPIPCIRLLLLGGRVHDLDESGADVVDQAGYEPARRQRKPGD